MDEFLTALGAMMELYLHCYRQLLKEGMNPEEATRNAKAIIEILLKQGDKNNGKLDF